MKRFMRRFLNLWPLAVLALCALLVTDRWKAAAAETQRLDTLVARYAEASGVDTKQARASAERDAAAKRINERNMLAPPKPQGFTGQLTGVLGDAAIFNGSQMVKVGQNAMGAKLLAIGADWAEIEFEGKKQTLQVFPKTLGGAPGSTPGSAPARAPGRGSPPSPPLGGGGGPSVGPEIPGRPDPAEAPASGEPPQERARPTPTPAASSASSTTPATQPEVRP